jgi:hypothetical protein
MVREGALACAFVAELNGALALVFAGAGARPGAVR